MYHHSLRKMCLQPLTMENLKGVHMVSIGFWIQLMALKGKYLDQMYWSSYPWVRYYILCVNSPTEFIIKFGPLYIWLNRLNFNLNMKNLVTGSIHSPLIPWAGQFRSQAIYYLLKYVELRTWTPIWFFELVTVRSTELPCLSETMILMKTFCMFITWQQFPYSQMFIKIN